MSFLNIFKTKKAEPEKTPTTKHIRVVLTACADSVKTRILLENLQQNPVLDVAYYSGSLPADSLKIRSKNLPEISDFCMRIFRKIPADVIILCHQEKDKICLNFAAYGEYEDLSAKNWRVLDCLYLPATVFEQGLDETAANLIFGALLLSKKNFSTEAQNRQRNLIKDLVKFFEKADSDYCLPYTLNLIAAIYFEYAADNLNQKSCAIIKFMLEKALQHKDELTEKIHIAPIYIHLGNLFSAAAQSLVTDSFPYYQKALQAYELAQKYFSKEEFPYDFAQISYLSAQTLFAQWRFTENLDSLREAISTLRRIEKIYTEKMFPASWAKIQHELGYYLSLLGSTTGSAEVLQLAVGNMKNAQKVFYKEKYPFIWMNVQADIGRVYYFMGKKYQDIATLQEAEKYLRAAREVCEEKNAETERRRIDSDISKTIEQIYLLHKR